MGGSGACAPRSAGICLRPKVPSNCPLGVSVPCFYSYRCPDPGASHVQSGADMVSNILGSIDMHADATVCMHINLDTPAWRYGSMTPEWISYFASRAELLAGHTNGREIIPIVVKSDPWFYIDRFFPPLLSALNRGLKALSIFTRCPPEPPFRRTGEVSNRREAQSIGDFGNQKIRFLDIPFGGFAPG